MKHHLLPDDVRGVRPLLYLVYDFYYTACNKKMVVLTEQQPHSRVQ